MGTVSSVTGFEVNIGAIGLVLLVAMFTFLLWCVLFVLCWPLALLALIAYPIIWLILLPFRLVGIAVGAVLETVWVMVTLPARLIAKIA